MAVHRAIGTRDPFPYPHLENDNDFAGKKSYQQFPYAKSERDAQNEQPWGRLYNAPTLSSTRHQVYSFDPKAPRDSLDFLLKTKYNHHKETLKPLNRTRVQPETLNENTGRVLKNRAVVVKTPELHLNHPLRISITDKNERIEQAKLGIGSHHTILTNNGYSRKPDGGFFTT